MHYRLLLLLQIPLNLFSSITWWKMLANTHFHSYLCIPTPVSWLGQLWLQTNFFFSRFPNWSKDLWRINELKKIFGTIWIQAIKYHAGQPCECLESLKCLKEGSSIPPQKLAVIVANLVHNEQSRHCFQSVSASISWIIFHLLKLTRGFLFFLIHFKYGLEQR